MEEERGIQEISLLAQSDIDIVPQAVDQVEESTTVRPGKNGDRFKRPQTPEYHESTRLMEAEFRFRELQTRLEMAEQEIEALRSEAQLE